jgi:MATE family multidrug resistance protein
MNSTTHPFTSRPHRTLLGLSIPVLLSLTAEPITALVDTAFISSLGVVPLAALGVGTTALSSLFWMFNFLGIGIQTEIAQIHGKGERKRAGKILSLALILAAGFGILLILVFGPTANWLAGLLGASGSVQVNAVQYMQIRLFGAPAVLLTLVIFGAFRGLQDMRTHSGCKKNQPIQSVCTARCSEAAAGRRRLIYSYRSTEPFPGLHYPGS